MQGCIFEPRINSGETKPKTANEKLQTELKTKGKTIVITDQREKKNPT